MDDAASKTPEKKKTELALTTCETTKNAPAAISVKPKPWLQVIGSLR